MNQKHVALLLFFMGIMGCLFGIQKFNGQMDDARQQVEQAEFAKSEVTRQRRNSMRWTT